MRSFHLFRWAGIDVYLHSSWFLVALFELGTRNNVYSSYGWNVLEYLALYGIVLIHEFGHALACRSVGGRADRIVLWPLGGVAFVEAPQRPGATLWSLAAGPLVNVALFPLFWMAAYGSGVGGDAGIFLHALFYINTVLLVFNLLPIYPLDGGQMLRSLLWYGLGPVRSLKIATGIGFVGVAGLLGLALWLQDIWLAAIAVFAVLNCWSGWKQARAMQQLADAPKHAGLACPGCHESPTAMASWRCGRCSQVFDGFETGGACPRCNSLYGRVRCAHCGAVSVLSQWRPETVTVG